MEAPMINERMLQRMYQQWCNGRENVALDWSYFVEFAAKQTEFPANEVATLLQRCNWFYWTTEDK
jgi:hypothetical protein